MKVEKVETVEKDEIIIIVVKVVQSKALTNKKFLNSNLYGKNPNKKGRIKKNQRNN